MKIKKIILFNIGPYKKMNVFEMNDNEKNIVLIGGKNGTGKTTFFKAIKTCLYGCKIWGYDAICKPYYEIISTLINNDQKLNIETLAFVEIDILFNDGKEDNVYTIKREWVKNGKSLIEKLNIFKNGEKLLDSEKNDFINYLSSIIPPAMFNFYFFDGEEITDFFLGNNGKQNFKDAFLKLYGLDTFSIMRDNFKRNIKNSENEKVYNEYYLAKDEYYRLISEKKKILKRIKEINKDIEELKSRKDSLINEYKNSGGITIEEWTQLNKELTYEEFKREEYSKKIKEIANNYLPFLILNDQLKELEKQLISYKKIRKLKNYHDIIESAEFYNYLKEKDIIDFYNILMDFNYKNDEKNIFDFSDFEYDKLISQLDAKINFNKKTFFNILKDIEKSLNNTKKIRAMLNGKSYDGYSTITNEVNKLEIERLEKEKELLNLENIVQKLLIEEEEKYKVYLRSKEQIQIIMKNESVSNISERALVAFELLEEKLISRQSRMLEEQFINIFKRIINKNNFLDGIVIDKDINLIPYKIESFNKEKLENYLSFPNNLEFLSLFNKTFDKKIAAILEGKVKTGKIPLRIDSPFSNGEKQVYIMSIYLALLQSSKRDIPFFIDTPFARIDTIHKEGIIEVFFKSINNQTFILSTDSEVYGKYKTQINDSINKMFLLYSPYHGETQILENQYFEGE